MSFVIGSATTHKGKPPSFNVMYVDPATMLPVDYEVYAFDLDKANSNGLPEWNLKYDYRQTYNMTDLSPDSFYSLSHKMHWNEFLAV